MSIITQLEVVRNQIRTHAGEVENSADVLAQLRESNPDADYVFYQAVHNFLPFVRYLGNYQPQP